MASGFTAEPTLVDCNGEGMAIAFAQDGGSFATFATFESSGAELSRYDVLGEATGLGIARGGWVVVDNLVRRFSGELLLTVSASQLTDYWAFNGTTVASIGYGPLLMFDGADWSPLTAPRGEFFRELPDGTGGTIQLFVGEEQLELWNRGSRVLTIPRSPFTLERNLTSRLWTLDSCSGDVLLGLRYDSRHYLASRRGGDWRLVQVPISSYLFATVDSQNIIVAPTQSARLSRPLLEDGPWVEEYFEWGLPSSPVRAIAVGEDVVAEFEDGIRLFTPTGSRALAPAGSTLLGVSEGWVHWGANDGVASASLYRE